MPQGNDQLFQRLGLRLRELRKRRGLTQQVLAERSRLSTNYVSELERGLRNPSVATLNRLVTEGLETDLSALFAVEAQTMGGRSGSSLDSQARDKDPGSYHYGREHIEALQTALKECTPEETSQLQQLLRSIANALEARRPDQSDGAGDD